MALTGDQHIDYKQLYEQQLAVIEQQLAEKEQLTKLVEAKRSRIEALSVEIAQLRKMIFGVRRERFVPAPEITPAQLQLALDLSVNSDHVDPLFWDVDPPAKQAIRVRT